MITLTRVDHINMTVKELDRSTAFYRSLFGFIEKESGTRNGRRWAILGVPERLYLCLYETGETAASGAGLRVNHFGFHISDFDAAAAELEARGLETESVDYGASRSLYVSDPDGYEIELSERLGGALH